MLCPACCPVVSLVPRSTDRLPAALPSGERQRSCFQIELIRFARNSFETNAGNLAVKAGNSSADNLATNAQAWTANTGDSALLHQPGGLPAGSRSGERGTSDTTGSDSRTAAPRQRVPAACQSVPRPPPLRTSPSADKPGIQPDMDAATERRETSMKAPLIFHPP